MNDREGRFSMVRSRRDPTPDDRDFLAVYAR
jgi:hypothetical protein